MSYSELDKMFLVKESQGDNLASLFVLHEWKKNVFRSNKLEPSALQPPTSSLCCQSSLLIIGKQAATIIALMVQPEKITSGHKERPWRWQPERKGANELKHFAFLWGMWPRFLFIKNKKKEF